MVKKFLLVILLILSLSVTGCRGTDVEDTNSEVNEDKDEIVQDTNDDLEDMEELDGLRVDKSGENTRIIFDNKGNFRAPIYNVKWENGNNFVLFHRYFKDNDVRNQIYNFNTTNKTIDKLFEIEGELWGLLELVKGGSEVIYSHNGFDGLYSLNQDGAVNQITKAQGWYHFSPDKKRIIINGIAADGSEDSEYKRYIYNTEEGLLEESPLIPNMDYAFSGIAATWSPNSIHISSQTGDRQNKLTIINGVENMVEKEILIEDSIISFPNWSPDGSKLAFLVQSKDKGRYVLEGNELYFYMSNKVGIYDTTDKSVSYIDLVDELTFSTIMWKKDSQGLFVETVSTKMADKLIDKTGEGSKTIEANFKFIDLNTNKVINIFKKDATYEYYNIPIIALPIELYDNNKLLYYTFKEDSYSIRVFDLEKNEDTEIFEDKYYYDGRWYQAEEGIIFVTNKGIFLINNSFKVTMIVDYDLYRENDVISIDASISPDHKKAIIGVEYQPDSGKKNFLEIVDLSY